jgi:regulatory protein
MRITQIVPQKNDPNRASVFIDGLFSFGASWEIVSRENLSEGREITQEEAKRLKAADLLLEAKKRGLPASCLSQPFQERTDGKAEVFPEA